MPAKSAGAVGIDLVLNGGKYEQQVAALQNKANLASNKISGAFKKIGATVATALSVRAVVRFGKECTKLGSDLAEVQNVVDVTFSTMNTKLNTWAKNAAASYGLSETMAKKFAGLYGTMARSSGLSEQAAYDMSTALTGLAGDVASFYNMNHEEAYTKLKAVFSGETEVLKDIGVVISQDALNSYALANGINKSVKDMTQAEKVSLRYEFILNQLSAAQGDFTRTQDNWANQVRVLQLRFDSLKATIGQGLINALTPTLKIVNKLIERAQVLAEAFSSAMGAIFGVSSSTSNAVASTVAAEQELTESAEDSASAVDGVTDSINDSAKAAKGSVASFDKLNILSKPDSDTSSSSGMISDFNNSDTSQSASNPPSSDKSESAVIINQKISSFFKDFYKKSGFKDFVDDIQRGINNIDWSSIEKNCKSILNKTQPIAKSILINTANTGKSALKTFGSYASGIITISGKSIQTVSGGIADWLKKDNQKIINFIRDVSTSLQNGFSNLSTFFDSWFELLGGSIDRMRPKIQEAISDFLSGLTDYGVAVGTIIADGFEIATESLVEWIEKDSEEISTFFTNIQTMASDTLSTFGTVFSDMGTIISDWWNGDGGSSIFADVCDMFTNIGTTFMNVWNDWIKPAWDFIVGVVNDAWNSWLRPIFSKVVSVVGKIGECISTLWNNVLSPIVNWFVDVMGPITTNILNAIRREFKTVFEHIGGIISAGLQSLGGLLDFITGVFSGDWEKAWQGIKDYFAGIWNGIATTLSTVVNHIIDGINLLWTALYNQIMYVVNGLGGIVQSVGELVGKDWGFSMPEKPPIIQRWEPNIKLAKGGIVKAPTLAVVGDNPGAGNGDPEVISPLSKLQTMMNTSSGQDLVILTQILDYLKRIYEMFVVFRNNGGNMYEFIAKLNDEPIFEAVVRQNELYKKRHNGQSAF